MATENKQIVDLNFWKSHLDTLTGGLVSVEGENLKGETGFDFTYISDYLPSNDVNIPNDPPIGCQCKSCSTKGRNGECCFANGSELFPYDSKGRIKVRVGTPIFECNSACSCPPSCRNRVVQKGPKVKVALFRTPNGKGWGVKILESVPMGTFICEYIGEVIRREDAYRRDEAYDFSRQSYMFNLDVNGEDWQYCIDSRYSGNFSRFINHSCDANLSTYNVWINCLDPFIPRIALFTNRDIIKDEELSIDYEQQVPSIDKQLKSKSSKGTECLCETYLCRKIIF